MAQNKGEDPNKPLFAGLLSFIIPGAGHWFIQSSRAMTYFIFFVVIVAVEIVLLFASLGICFPIVFLSTMFQVGSAIDAYYEARGEDDKRVLKSLIK